MPLTDLNKPDPNSDGLEAFANFNERDEIAYKLFDGYTGLINIPDLSKQLETALNNGIRTGSFKYWDASAGQWKDVFIFGNILHHDSSGKVLLQSAPSTIDPKSYLHIRRAVLSDGLPGGEDPLESETPFRTETNGVSRWLMVGDQASDQIIQMGNQAKGASFRQIWNHDADLFRLLWHSGSVIGMKGGRIGIGSDLTGRDAGLVINNGVGSVDGAVWINGGAYPIKIFNGGNEDVHLQPGQGNGAMVICENGQTCVIGNGAITSGWKFDVWDNGASRFRVKENQIFAGVDIDMNGKKIINGAAATTGTGFVIKDQMDSADATLQSQINTNASNISTNAGDIATNASDIATNASDIAAIQVVQADGLKKYRKIETAQGAGQIDFGPDTYEHFKFKAVFRDNSTPGAWTGPRIMFFDQRGIGETPSLGEGNFRTHFQITTFDSQTDHVTGLGEELVQIIEWTGNHHYLIKGEVSVFDGRILAKIESTIQTLDGSKVAFSHGSVVLDLTTSPPVSVTAISGFQIRMPYSTFTGELLAYAQH